MKTEPEIKPFIRRLLVLFIFAACVAHAQTDSINLLLSKEGNPEKKTDILLRAANTYSGSERSITFSKQAYGIAVKTGKANLIARAAEALSLALYEHSPNDSVTKYLDIATENYASSGDKKGLYNTLSNKTKLLLAAGNTKEAFNVNKQLISIAEELNDAELMANAYSRMGRLFYRIDDTEKSLFYYQKALKLFKQKNNLAGIEKTYCQLGDCYTNKSHYDLAIECYERGLEVNKQTSDPEQKVNFLVGIGNVYYNLDNNEKALYFYKEALANSFEKDNNFIKNNIASVLMNMDRYKEAKPYLLEFYYLSTVPDDKAVGAFNLAQTYEQLGDYNSAMDFMDIYVRINDSLNSARYSSNLSEIEAKYRNEKQEEQNILLNERLKRKSLQIYFALAAILLLSVLAFFIFRGLRQKNKANKALAEKNKIIHEKSIIVAEQHKDITDSIKYAQRIQKAILPPDRLWSSILPQSFVFYQPKDILSGDFYWIEDTPEFIFIGAADCTGHGVPGALMSIVNYNLLNKAVLERGLTDAGSILDSVNKSLTQSLHQTFQESAMRDGMDISLCVINKATRQMNYAGAYNSIYIVRNNEIKELMPDKQPVGAFMEDNIKPFTNQYFQLSDQDVVYMFSDGYADQFGGPKGKKYKYKKMQALLLENHQKPFAVQKAIAAASINEWKGNLEQVDDILLLGFRLV
jgi:serine phosphatase RsbU (regulator of sigma subunit)